MIVELSCSVTARCPCGAEADMRPIKLDKNPHSGLWDPTMNTTPEGWHPLPHWLSGTGGVSFSRAFCPECVSRVEAFVTGLRTHEGENDAERE